MSERFDVVILGAGPAGEVAAGILNRAGLHVALLERELVGGECGYWACIPSKTLLRPPEAQSESERVAGGSRPKLDWQRIVAYRDWMIRNLDDTNTVSNYEKRGVTVIKGSGRLAGPGRVEVNGALLETARVIVATGSGSYVPPIEGLEEAGYWTNREATTLNELPTSALFIGGGPVGIELGQMLARFGTEVTIVHDTERILKREEPRVSELIEAELEQEGIRLVLGRSAERVRSEGREKIVGLDDGSELQAETLVVSAGRSPRVRGLGLETVGIEAGSHGIVIDQRCRAAEGVWAIGDCTGISLFTHVSKYQGRIAAADILGEEAKADYRAIPRVVFSDPEVAAVGLTEAQAREQGIDVATAEVDLVTSISRPYTYEENPRGTLGIAVDRKREVLIGAWAVAPLASEWIHQAVLAIRAEIPLAVLKDTVAQFPTYTEGYLSALRALPR